MNTLKFLSICFLLLILTLSVQAQDEKGAKPVIYETMYIHQNIENRNVSLDSLLSVYKEKIIAPNQYFESSKILRHWWGSDSRQVVFMYELKSWDDISKAFDRQDEIMKEHKGWATEADAKAFRKLWWAFFNDAHHSDEIYEVVAE